nr:molybdenum cofactor guanylyltransferase [Paenibacillus hamazuiensis]
MAGGSNRRMGGRFKALLPWNGRPLIEHQLEQMRRLCSDIVIVTNRPDDLAMYACGTVRLAADLHPGEGPLAGMQAAWAAARGDLAWIVACDMPFVSAAAAEAMAELQAGSGCEAVVPQLDGRVQPLHGVYSRSCAERIDRLLAGGERRVMRLLDGVSWRAADEAFFAGKGIDLRFVLNINSVEQYEALCYDK